MSNHHTDILSQELQVFEKNLMEVSSLFKVDEELNELVENEGEIILNQYRKVYPDETDLAIELFQKWIARIKELVKSRKFSY